ncbi:MAG: hypothetical protein J6Y19_02115, partial [Kiritimatiellae bacterium]|nr:hypothetical protein [Kiritimatiellia bacterium]
MKKWLVGLMAAGLCAASASAETNTVAYFVQNKAVTVMQGVAPEGSSAIYSQTYNGTSGQATGGTSITLTLKGYEGTTVTGLRLAMHSNSKTGAGSLSATCGDAIIGSIADAPFNDQNWYGAWSQIFVDVTVPVTPTVIDDDIVITIAASSNSLYCEEFYIDYIPAVPTFSVSLDPGDDFTAVLDTPTDIRAIAENATGSVEYAWTLDGEPTDVLGDTFIVDTSVSGGSHEVVCVATDTGTGATSEASVNYTVVGAYTVTVADGIENGSVAVWGGETELGNPADVLEGTTLKVVAMPATRSYKVESITVTGETSGEITLENDEFTMPAENVFVTATFAERSGDLFEKITSEDELEAGAYVITGASADGTEYAMLNEANTSTATDHIKRKETPEDVSFDSISGPEDSVIWTLAKDDTGWTIHNADGGYVCYVPNMGNSANLEGEPSSKSHWTIAATEHGLFEVSNVGDSTRVLRYNPDNPRFACYSNPSSGKSLAFYKRSGSGTFSLSLDPSGEDVVFAEGEGGAITATAKNAQGEVTYAWNVTQDDTPGSANGNVWTIPADAPAGGPWTVYCAATDGTSEADQSVSFSIVAAPVVYEVTIAENIENGTVTVEPASGVAGTAITVTATPDPGYALVAIQVNGEDIAGNVFEMPEGGALVGATFEESAVKIATYTVASTDAVEATGDVPAGSEAEYSSTYGTPCQLLGGTHMTLKLKGYEGATITGLALSMRSNSRGGAGSLDAVCGDAVIATIADSRFNEESWYGSWSQNYVPITPAVAPTVVDDDVVITIAASANSLYCESFTIEYESGSPVFSVTLDPAEHFDVIQGEEATITATAKNAVGDVTYAWTVDGEPQATIGPIFTLESVVVGGPHEVVCVATDTGAEGVTAEASVSYTVAAPTPSYAVAVADGIENGEVAVDKAEAKAGETVTVTATPDDGYVLEAILVDGEPIGGDSFEMPDHDVTVSATFSPVADYATLPFLADNTPFTGPWQNAKAAGVTVGGLGTDYNSADGRGARFDDTGDWLQIKFEGTPDELSYALKGNGVSGDYVFDVQESATGGEGPWTTVASYPANGELKQSKAAFTNELSDNSRFVRFVYSTKAGGNVALYDVYISSGEFSVSFDKEDGFEVEQGTADRISATVKNGEEPYYFIWSCEQAAALNAEDEGLDTLVIPATLGVGDYT